MEETLYLEQQAPDAFVGTPRESVVQLRSIGWVD